jgi:predicted transport protein
MAANIWATPALSADILQAYRPVPAQGTSYSIDDHPQLIGGITRELFDAFRAEVLALDECVAEEFLKLYVAYKAETNFVDVVPQAKRLRISINLKFPEIDDPRGICKDVTNKGRWGNGDIEVILDKLEDLNYVVGLSRQALDKQLGGED